MTTKRALGIAVNVILGVGLVVYTAVTDSWELTIGLAVAWGIVLLLTVLWARSVRRRHANGNDDPNRIFPR